MVRTSTNATRGEFRKPLDIPVLKHRVLGVEVLRGYARLCDLAVISRADIFDAAQNPTGTQRDLSPKHARDAYSYVRREELGFWPEVFLCARNSSIMRFHSTDKVAGFGVLSLDFATLKRSRDVLISRVDGNHRLYFAGGEFEGFEPIEKIVSFCLAYNLNLTQEIKLFRDINNNQRRMSTSHLDNITVRLSGSDALRYTDPPLYIANRLSRESSSPLKGLVYEGGKAVSGLIPLRALKTGLEYMLSRPTNLTSLDEPEAQYKIIRNYFIAIKKWIPEAWKEPKKYIALRGAGLWAICFIGAEVIHRTLASGAFRPEDMLAVLNSGRKWDWSNKGDFRGFSGRGGATSISAKVTKELQDERGVSVRELFKKIMDDEGGPIS